jgi:hypothetical protein
MKQAQLATQKHHDASLETQIQSLVQKLGAYQTTALAADAAPKSQLVQLGKKRASGEVVPL